MTRSSPTQHPLDNPVWHALTGPQARFALGGGPLRFFAPAVAPFAAFGERDEAALTAALADLPDGPDAAPTRITLLRPQPESAPAVWTLAYQSSLVQMVCPNDLQLVDSAASVVRLGPADLPEMLDLVALTQPGPFGPRTPELGAYFGVREGGRLVAMGGERLRPGGYTEVSAVCTHPDWRGHGLAGRTVSRVARHAFSEGQTPFLHVMTANTGAIGVYEALGFVERNRLQVSVWARP
ncbi:GNAT family N-acetyltransferase [Deinococcus alpinitundrae]|uniref:GNAT family N-acetyltransferase n=1 Tax=Deinococcus alpinitundrae TaxID=468913 RepID=UPI00137987FF|nr:GNAT family N-acetyltransferase [Deinococcus alpinitundrae]